MNFEIRRLNKNDIELARQAVLLFIDTDEVVSGDNQLSKLLLRDDFYFIAAIKNGEVLGRLIAYEFELFKNNTREVYLYEIDVLEPFKKIGIATRLVNFTKQICQKRGVSYMFVGTDEDNIPAQKLYLKTGGKLEGNLPHFEYEF